MLRELSLASAEQLLNQLLKLDTEACDLLAPLAGKILCLRLSQPEFQLYLLFSHHRIDLMQQYDGVADAGILGEVGQLLDFLRPATRNRAQVTLSGDLELIQHLQRLVFELSPDWQSRVSQVIGEPLTAWLERRLRQDRQRLPRHLQWLLQTLTELLRDEAQLSVGQAQLASSQRQLSELRSQIHQIERRLARLEQP